MRIEIGAIVRATERGVAQAGDALDRETRADIEEALERCCGVSDEARCDGRALQQVRDALDWRVAHDDRGPGTHRCEGVRAR